MHHMQMDVLPLLEENGAWILDWRLMVQRQARCEISWLRVWALLREEGGAAVDQLSLSGTLGIQVIEGPDHTFTPRWSHPLLLDAIESALP